MSSRVKGWEDRYVKFILGMRSTQFEFGKHDCCITACNMIREIVGFDPAGDFRDSYSSPMQAMRIVKEHGDVDGVAEKVCAQFGWKEIDPAYGTRCDLVCLYADRERKALGWLDLDSSKIFAAGAVGLQIRPRNEAVRAWRIS